tara:strand:+ start:82 stop:426 length:345 start_codon:yes stop_codon:yes gene_type:complete
MDTSVKGKNLDADTAPAFHVAVQLNGALDRMTKQLQCDKPNVFNHHAKRPAAERMLPARQYDICEDNGDKEVYERARPHVIAKMPPEIATITVNDAVIRMEMGGLPARKGNHIT